MISTEDSEKFGKTFKERKPKKKQDGLKRLNTFKRTLLYFLLAIQFYLSITIVILESNKEYSGISASIVINRLIFGFIIVTIINGLFGWSIGYSFSVDKTDKRKYFYSQSDRIIGRVVSIVSFILFVTVIISFIVSSFDILK